MADLKAFSKSQFKKLVKLKIRELNRSKLMKLVRDKQYVKVDSNLIENDDFKVKPYFNSLRVSHARTRFKLNAHMLPTVKMNFPSDRKFKSEIWACSKGCRQLDSQEHILVCPAYENFRSNLDLNSDKGLVAYFKLVLEDRMQNSEF